MQRSTKDGSEGQLAKAVRVARAADELGVSPRTIWRLMAKGELERVQIGRAVRVKASSIEAFLAKGGRR
jgi:excisionase family DNA binding protein